MTTPPSDASLEAALALGGTRVATAAHPLCICHRPILGPQEAEPVSGDYATSHEWVEALREHFIGRVRRIDEARYRQRYCSVHGSGGQS